MQTRHGAAAPEYLVVLATFNSSGSAWARHTPHPLFVLDKNEIPNVGFDASTYLWWIIQNYHALPSWCLFMHDHEYHWHHPFYSQLVSMGIDVKTMGHGYLNVAHDKDGMMQVYEKGALLELNTSENEQVLSLCAAVYAYFMRGRYPSIPHVPYTYRHTHISHTQIQVFDWRVKCTITNL